MTKTLLSLSFLFISFAVTMGQIPFRVMSYNVENLFDTYDDPDTDDGEFLPSGHRRWTPSRYRHKLRQISRVISAAGEWDTPALVGLCEVESDTALMHLLLRTPLRSQGYRYCLSRGSDQRGIQVALLYQRDKFRYLGHGSRPVRLRAGTRPTRDILHVWGEVSSGDTLDVFVCHFPSKYGGEKETESRRTEAACTLKQLCDSLMHVRLNPLQIMMGDFNESPESECMQIVAGASHLNLFAGLGSAFPRGSHKYQGEWSQLDQILIHRRMNTLEASMRFVSGSARCCSLSFLFTEDKTWRGKRPHRTYHGYTYEAGYSDHLPVLADFVVVAE
ncbi:MAG: endonuclease [Tannerellaceae bacterium]|nr:endonuclease [Tannerellaceae bacterium]